MRLQQDLNTSVVESRNLAKQMQTWKEQLSVGAGSDFGLDDMMSADDVASPEVTRAKQEQAYRSVGALQLRVEELTMEVTKVYEIAVPEYFLSDYSIDWTSVFAVAGGARHATAKAFKCDASIRAT